MFCGQQLIFVDMVTHLWHRIHYDLSDAQDINQKLHDMVEKASCVLASLPHVGPVILTCLLQTYFPPSIVQQSGYFPVLPSIKLRLPSTRFLEGFGTYPFNVILV